MQVDVDELKKREKKQQDKEKLLPFNKQKFVKGKEQVEVTSSDSELSSEEEAKQKGKKGAAATAQNKRQRITSSDSTKKAAG